jgi:hypothetical protein
MKKQVLWFGMVLLTLAVLPLLGGGASLDFHGPELT